MLGFHAHPLEPKKYETKSRLVKPGHGMPVRTHDCRARAHASCNASIARRWCDSLSIARANSSHRYDCLPPPQNRDFPLKSHASKRFNHTKMALPKFKGTLLLKYLVASCVLISSVGAESTAPPPPAPPSPSPPCGDTDPSFCEAELHRQQLWTHRPILLRGRVDDGLGQDIAKCSFTSTFFDKCKGTCSFCPAPPPSPPPPSPSCSDKEGETCNKKKCDKYPLRKKRKCRKTCDLCVPLGPPASPPAATPAPETNCSGLADKKKCKITKMVEKCQKKPPKSMSKCQKNCKKDGKKKPPLCEKTCCELGF